MQKCDECDREYEFEVTVADKRGYHMAHMHLCMIHFRQ
jgi:hypothetical protein